MEDIRVGPECEGKRGFVSSRTVSSVIRNYSLSATSAARSRDAACRMIELGYKLNSMANLIYGRNIPAVISYPRSLSAFIVL